MLCPENGHRWLAGSRRVPVGIFPEFTPSGLATCSTTHIHAHIAIMKHDAAARAARLHRLHTLRAEAINQQREAAVQQREAAVQQREADLRRREEKLKMREDGMNTATNSFSTALLGLRVSIDRMSACALQEGEPNAEPYMAAAIEAARAMDAVAARVFSVKLEPQAIARGE